MRGTVKDAWASGEQKRQPLLARAQNYAAYTIPIICPPDGYDEQAQELQTDYQAVGALAVNSLSNKLILALFAPSRPFMRYDVPADVLDRIGADAAGNALTALAAAERNSMRLLDQLSTRPRLYEAVRNLIVTGNCLLILGEDKTTPLRVLGLRKYVVKRSMSGKVVEIIIKQTVRFDELDADAQRYLKGGGKGLTKYEKMDPADPRTCEDVDWFTWVRLADRGKYEVTSYVDEHELPASFSGSYAEEELPYRVLTWELPDGQHYGIGLVEQCAGDFAAMSTLSEAQLRAAVLASEFRWLCNPGGLTQPEDMEQSENGAAIPGVEGDVVALSAAGAGVAAGLQIMDAVLSKYVNRIGRTFLLGSSVVRDAERVTAEEIRMQAQELETSLGGVYSRLAIDFQLPLAYWLARMLGVRLVGTAIQPTIITGLDALSRNADLDNLKLCIADLAQLQAVLQGPLATVLNATSISSAIFAGRGVDAAQYVNSAEVQQQLRAQQQQEALEQATAGPIAQAALDSSQ
ncbi:portal protein [Bordetella bronchiseptica]|uniref:portal protein n=1 Tax=Bordetella bronchiseptica TaxID=518 RepID=UPI0004619621|nr:portal protein [Bordetella bronchiseptica]KDD18609.1 bacteriophage head to tail connecting protein [Bordetella bronchiseptica MBORD707]